jgi:hypothetical protein
MRPITSHRDKLSTEEIERIVVHALTTFDLTAAEAAAEIGFSRQSVEKIRAGITRSSVHPDLPRWRSCQHCEHFPRGECTFGFPDPEEDGVWRAATDCNMYEQKNG